MSGREKQVEWDRERVRVEHVGYCVEAVERGQKGGHRRDVWVDSMGIVSIRHKVEIGGMNASRFDNGIGEEQGSRFAKEPQTKNYGGRCEREVGARH